MQKLRQTVAVGVALATRGTASVLQLVLNILMARLTGPEGVGVYYLFISWTNVLGTIVGLGMPVYLLQAVSSLEVHGQHAVARRMVNVALLLTLVVGAVVALPLWVFSRRLAGLGMNDSGFSYVVRYASVAAVWLALTRILAETLKARGRPSLGMSVEFNVVPALLVAALAAAWLAKVTVHVDAVLLGQVVASAAVVLGAYRLAVKGLAKGPGASERPRWAWRRMAVFWGIVLMNHLFVATPYFVLPHVATPAEVGQFGVAHRLVSLSATILLALASLFAPRFAKAQATNDRAGLLRAFRSSQFYSLLFYLPFLAVYTIFSDKALAVFGGGFGAAKPMLWVMALLRVVNSASGLTEYFLSMTGKELWELGSAAGALALMLVLSIVLGRRSGALGVAWAFAVAWAMRGMISYVVVYRSLRAMPEA